MSAAAPGAAAPSPRAGRWAALRNGPVEYRTAHPPSRAAELRPIVLLHEGLGSLATWRDLPERLASVTGRSVTAFSRYGYGRSAPARLPRPTRYMHEEALVVLPELLGVLGIAAPVLLGHSDGASIALIHAGAGNPVTGVVALAPHVVVEERTLDGIRSARDEFRGGALRDRLDRHHDDVDAAFAGWNDVWLDPAFAAWSIEDHLPAVEAPVLAVQCADDPYGTVGQLDRIERGVAGPVTRLVFDTGGHAPHRSHRDDVLDAVRRFCAPLP